MQNNSMRWALATMATVLAVHPAIAKEHHRKNANYRVLAQAPLDDDKTIDLFVRQDKHGHKYLYLATASGKLSIFDVSKQQELHEVNAISLSNEKRRLVIRRVNERMAIATTAPDASENLTILDLDDAPSVKVAEVMKNVDAYAIDSSTNTIYSAQPGKLVVIQFNHPVTRDAEIWEQWYENR